MSLTKRCIGCREDYPINDFYKNKLVLDGHSNYCINCTKENSKKYFQRKKEKNQKMQSDNQMKMILLSNFNGNVDSKNADNLVKIMMIEKMCNSILDELTNLKKSFIQIEDMVSK